MLSYIKENIVPKLTYKIQQIIDNGGESCMFGTTDNYASACECFERDDKSYEVNMKVKYSEYGGGSDPYSDAYRMYVNDIDITCEGDDIEFQYIRPELVGVKESDFEI